MRPDDNMTCERCLYSLALDPEPEVGNGWPDGVEMARTELPTAIDTAVVLDPEPPLRAGPIECHRYPPQTTRIVIPTEQGLAAEFGFSFPQVARDGWCGEHVDRARFFDGNEEDGAQ